MSYKYESKSKVLPYFGNVKHNSTAPDSFGKCVKVQLARFGFMA